MRQQMHLGSGAGPTALASHVLARHPSLLPSQSILRGNSRSALWMGGEGRERGVWRA